MCSFSLKDGVVAKRRAIYARVDWNCAYAFFLQLKRRRYPYLYYRRPPSPLRSPFADNLHRPSTYSFIYICNRKNGVVCISRNISLLNLMLRKLANRGGEIFLNNLRIFSKMTTNQGPRPLVLCGPSGSGKSTMLNRLFSEFPNTFGFSVSHTTRQPRSGEEDGIHYHFVTKDIMETKITCGDFIETAVFSGNVYGTSKEAVEKVQSEGKVCILDIEPQGVEQVKKTNLNPVLVYNNPPTLEALEIRLRKRKSETEESLKRRLQAAVKEIEYGLTPGNFHKIIHNVDIDQSYAEFKEFILNELKAQETAGIAIRWD